MTLPSPARLIFGFGTVCLAACSSSSGPPACVEAPIVFAPPALAYPIPGATGVSATLRSVLVAAQQSTAHDFVRLQSAGFDGAELPLVSPPSPLPSPLATLAPPGLGAPQYLAANLEGSLRGQTTYEVFLDHRVPAGTPCDGDFSLTLGSFTTQ